MDAREQVAGTRAGACRETGDQDHGVGDQERDTARPGHRGRCMEKWGWGLRGPGSTPGEPGHRALGQRQGTGTGTQRHWNQYRDME